MSGSGKGSGFSRWFTRRFITLVTTMGYLLVAVIGLAVGYSLITTLDVKAIAQGTIKPTYVSVTAPSEVVVVSFKVQPGEMVKEGDDICRVAIGAEDVQWMRVYFGLVDLEESLRDASSPKLRALRLAIDLFQKDEVPRTKGRPFAVTASGGLQYGDGVKPGSVIVEGDELARVYQAERLVLEGRLDTNNADQVKEGQQARITSPAHGLALTGQVSAKSEKTNAVVIDIDEPTEAAKAFFADRLGDPDAWPTARVEVIVETKSLFSTLFGKK